MRLTFPEGGMGKERVLAALEQMKADDADWQGGRVPLFVFRGSDEATEVAQAAFNLYFTENALGRHRAFPSLDRMEREIVAMALDLFHAPGDATGFVTTGGTESIIQAVQTCRDCARSKRGDASHRGNIVMAISGHPAFDKAARLMDLEVRRMPVSDELTADAGAIEGSIDNDTIMIVGSAPCFPYGVFDPISELAEVARSRGVWLHVDACVGGYLAPFVRVNGGRVPDFDFSIDGVSSLSADLHKFGYAPKPISTLFYRSGELARFHGFEFSGWPNGRFATTTIVGTRAGGAIAGAWALFNYLGRAGYRDIAGQLMDGVAAYRAGIDAIDGLRVLGDPELSIVAFTADGFDIFEVAELMKEKGWTPGLLQQPKAIHRMMSMLHVPAMADYLRDLGCAVAAARGSSGDAGLRAEY
ncbi:MAG: aminotransferase class V-fold PLP-dependent enzyme [Alphaproteobacteria bacterium]|nr:aminotransferase class V-fold PLP-dependent enzyme [Alphaproteobacteria bacterium]